MWVLLAMLLGGGSVLTFFIGLVRQKPWMIIGGTAGVFAALLLSKL